MTLAAATQQGGRPDGWSHDVWSLVVWAAIGCGDWPDHTPDADITRHAQQGGDPTTVLESLAPTLAQQPVEVVLAAAWAGLARYSLSRRDQAIRRAVQPAGPVSARQLASRVGLSHVAIGTIRDRDDDRDRWC